MGTKYIKLYSHEESSYLYPHEGMLTNTSQVSKFEEVLYVVTVLIQVDVENPNLSKFPLFSNAKYTECILSAGKMLYIPPKCWHYVRSLSVSFSVSFWW